MITKDGMKQIRDNMEKVGDIGERIFELSKKEKAEVLEAIAWIADNNALILEVELANAENEHKEHMKFIAVLGQLLVDERMC